MSHGERVQRNDVMHDAFIPIEDLPGPPTAGACTCACKVQTNAEGNAIRRADGSFVDSTECSCERVIGLRVDEYGENPKVVTEPCTPPTPKTKDQKVNNTLRMDATLLHRALLKSAIAAVQSNMWRTDANALPRRRGTVGKVSSERVVPIVASTPGDPGDGFTVRAFDTARFERNPCVLWAHDARAFPIGTAENIEQGPNGELRMNVRLASVRANPFAEQVLAGIEEGVVRAVSVRFDPREDGTAELIEVSFVPVGMDEDAGTAALNPAAGRGKRYAGGPEDDLDEDEDERSDANDADDDAADRATAAARKRRDEYMANVHKSGTRDGF